jgi:hypothetical protein
MPHQAMLACILSSVSCMSLESSSDGGLCVNLKLAFFYVTRSTHLYWLRIASNLFLFQHCLSSWNRRVSYSYDWRQFSLALKPKELSVEIDGVHLKDAFVSRAMHSEVYWLVLRSLALLCINWALPIFTIYFYSSNIPTCNVSPGLFVGFSGKFAQYGKPSVEPVTCHAL